MLQTSEAQRHQHVYFIPKANLNVTHSSQRVPGSARAEPPACGLACSLSVRDGDFLPVGLVLGPVS